MNKLDKQCCHIGVYYGSILGRLHAARSALQTFHWQLLQQMPDPIHNYYNAFIPTYTTTEVSGSTLYISMAV